METKTHFVTGKVQEEAIPYALAGNDLVAQAKSGMGKTLVFVIPILESLREALSKDPSLSSIHAVVIVHVKELAHQVLNEFKRFTKYLSNIRVAAIYGGEDIGAQRKMLTETRPQIIVSTPGRLYQLVTEANSVVDMSQLKMFVIDEVDQVLVDLSLAPPVPPQL
jgi:ATP-dependent RNA helicase UAP56/SUB2